MSPAARCLHDEVISQVNGRGPRYQQIAEALRERIRGGEWAPGASLPNQRKLAQSF